MNVVFILADDLGWGELGCYGQRKIPTPNIDRLAAQGMRFTQHYSGAPVCAPSRCVLMTGKHLGHAEVRGNRQAHLNFPEFSEGQYPLSEQAVTIAQLFQKAGYATGAMGKWGLGPVGSTGDPNRKGFDLFFGYNCQSVAHSFYPPHLWRNAEKITINTRPIPGHAKQPEGEVKLDDWIGETHAPTLMVAEAEKFIATHASRPFFLYLPFTEPHVAIHPPRESVEKFPAEWDREVYRGENGYLPHPRPRAGYAAMISDLDGYVGRVLAAVDRAGVADRTLVVFTSDNGTTHEGRAEPRFHVGGADPKFFNSTAGLRGYKGSVYEGGIRVPMIARLAGRIAAGTVNGTPGYFADWFPTLCDAAGLEKPGGLDGQSLWPVLTGLCQTLDSRKPMIWVFPEYGGQVAVRIDNFKVVRQGLKRKKPGAWEVYDLAQDRGEANDLAATRGDLIQQVEDLLRHEVSENPVFPVPIPGFARETAARAETKDRPNVVVFLADDAGWGDYSQTGNTQVRTPHIDSLAQQGVTFDRFFVCPVCSPTRAEFLTGRYHPRGGVRGVSTGQERLDLDERTIADAFRAAGYATGAFGKWHNGSQYPYHPMGRGFDEFFGHTAGHWGEYFDPPLEENGRMIPTRGYIVDVCTDRAIEFIDRNQAKPFFCYIPFTTPHSPWAVPDRDWQRFKNKPITQRATLPDQEVVDHTRCALAMIENQDANVGRVLAKLDELQLTDNTIVLYFSDNGPNSWRSNGGMKGRKGSTDEGGVRSVCFCRWPAKLPAGHTVTQIAGAIDLMPTLTSLAGVPRVGDKRLDGCDLSPLLLQQATDWPDRMIFSTWAGRVSVRTQTYRLDNQGKLFDMLADPGQTAPISDRRPEVAARLRQAVVDWRQEVLPPGTGEKRPGGDNAVDPRPLPVGYREFPITILPARDGEPRGNVRRSSKAPNCSYFVNWTSKDDSMVWLLDVHTTGRYEVVIDYTCPVADTGSLIEVSCGGDHRLTGRVAPGWDPPLYTNQDTLPRPDGESQMKEFRPLKLGEIALAQGEALLTLRALEIPGKSAMDVRRITLTLLP